MRVLGTNANVPDCCLQPASSDTNLATTKRCGWAIILAARRERLMSKKRKISRRRFLTNVAPTGAALAIVPRHVLGRGFVPPSDTLNIAGVGVGGMGRANLINLASQNIVAICDVDLGYAGKSLDRLDSDIDKLRARIDGSAPTPPPADFDRVKAQAQLDNMLQLKTKLPKAKRHKDYRDMLEHQKDIDA